MIARFDGVLDCTIHPPSAMQDTAVTNLFAPHIVAQFVRVHPRTWNGVLPCMRIELYQPCIWGEDFAGREGKGVWLSNATGTYELQQDLPAGEWTVAPNTTADVFGPTTPRSLRVVRLPGPQPNLALQASAFLGANRVPSVWQSPTITNLQHYSGYVLLLWNAPVTSAAPLIIALGMYKRNVIDFIAFDDLIAPRHHHWPADSKSTPTWVVQRVCPSNSPHSTVWDTNTAKPLFDFDA